ncbi:unnamed protein product [Lathyrus oleraceus]
MIKAAKSSFTSPVLLFTRKCSLILVEVLKISAYGSHSSESLRIIPLQYHHSSDSYSSHSSSYCAPIKNSIRSMRYPVYQDWKDPRPITHRRKFRSNTEIINSIGCLSMLLLKRELKPLYIALLSGLSQHFSMELSCMPKLVVD